MCKFIFINTFIFNYLSNNVLFIIYTCNNHLNAVKLYKTELQSPAPLKLWIRLTIYMRPSVRYKQNFEITRNKFLSWFRYLQHTQKRQMENLLLFEIRQKKLTVVLSFSYPLVMYDIFLTSDAKIWVL